MMQLDGRLSRMLHILIHMDRTEGPITSEAAAEMLHTNPVVVRRTMAGLRDAGHVRSVKGHGGGWTLARPLDGITMLDIYRAVGEPRIFAIGLADPEPACLVEQAVNASMTSALRDAEAMLIDRLGQVTLAEIAGDFKARSAIRGEDGLPPHSPNRETSD
jgi:DNA-binding IscR family transcriptional regulator